MSSWYFLPLYFQAVRGASPVYSGVLLMPIVVVQAVTGVAVGGIIYRFGCTGPVVWTGMTFVTLGIGLFIAVGRSTSLNVIFAIEVVTALGVGAVFQAPLVAYQAMVEDSDMAVATALFGFIRSIATSMSVVIGGVVFQNKMKEHQDLLGASLGTSLAQKFSASHAASNALLVRLLSSEQQVIVKDAYVSSLNNMWKVYTVVGGLGFVAALFTKRQLPSRSSNGMTVAAERELDEM